MGRDLSTSPAVAVRVLGALANRRINVNLIDHGAQKMNMMVGVSGADYEAVSYTHLGRTNQRGYLGNRAKRLLEGIFWQRNGKCFR